MASPGRSRSRCSSAGAPGPADAVCPLNCTGIRPDGVVLAQRVADPVLGHEDAGQVGMAVEADAEHVERLALHRLGAGPQVEQRTAARRRRRAPAPAPGCAAVARCRAGSPRPRTARRRRRRAARASGVRRGSRRRTGRRTRRSRRRGASGSSVEVLLAGRVDDLLTAALRRRGTPWSDVGAPERARLPCSRLGRGDVGHGSAREADGHGLRPVPPRRLAPRRPRRSGPGAA